MTSQWIKDFVTKRTCRDITAKEVRVDPNHNVLILLRNGMFDCYVEQHDETGSYPFTYMFGLQKGSMTYDKVIETACVNAPDYYDLFKE